MTWKTIIFKLIFKNILSPKKLQVKKNDIFNIIFFNFFSFKIAFQNLTLKTMTAKKYFFSTFCQRQIIQQKHIFNITFKTITFLTSCSRFRDISTIILQTVTFQPSLFRTWPWKQKHFITYLPTFHQQHYSTTMTIVTPLFLNIVSMTLKTMAF
jgi:hypothetical protein